MAYCISRSKVTAEQLTAIESMLCFIPDVPRNKYNRNRSNKPIIFYRNDGETLTIPYLFAASLFQIIPNIEYPFPQSGLRFTGQLRQNQVAVEAEAWKQLSTYGTSTLGLYPGFGKTILGAKLAANAGLLTVVLVHREILASQWKKTFQDHTNAHDKIWIVGEKNYPAECNIIICMDTRWDLIPAAYRRQVGFMIVDEAHCFCTYTRTSCLLAFQPKYILIETASLLREDKMELMIYALAGEHGVFRESNKPFNIMKIVTNVKPVRKMNRFGGVDYNALVRTTLMDDRRNNIILNLVQANTSFKILILTKLVDHARHLNDIIRAHQITSDCLCGKDKGYQDANVLVGTISKIGTGFDQANFCDTYAGVPFDLLILVCSLKKYSMLVQNVGRCFRSKNPTVMHLVDDDNIYKNHWYKARRWYLKHNGTITNHNIENKDRPAPKDVAEIQEEWAKQKAAQLRHRTLNLDVQT